MTVAIWTIVAVGTVAFLAAGLSANRVPVGVSVAIGAIARVGFALMSSQRYTPLDVRVVFHSVGMTVLHGHDPLLALPLHAWNFLELMPYIWAASIKTGLPWVYAAKIAPILADVVLIWIVSRLAGDNGRTRALQYAVNPLSLMVASLHGQVEPVALALALGGVLALRRQRLVLAGTLLGAAIAVKTFPVVILLAVLPLRRPREAARIVLASAVVPVACLLSGVIFLDTNVVIGLGRVVGYTDIVDVWTWSAALIMAGHTRLLGLNSPVAGVASALIVAGVTITLVLLRRHPREARALGGLCAVLVCTAGFGVQWLLWVLPLAVAISGRWRYPYLLAATGWAWLFYLSPFQHADSVALQRTLSWVPWAMLVALILEQVRRGPGQPEAEPASVSEPLAVSLGRPADELPARRSLPA